MAHNVICYYCKNKFDRDKEKYVKVKNNRYAHSECAIKNGKNDLEIIDPNRYIECNICKKQIDTYKEEYITLQKNKIVHKECYQISDEDKLNDYIKKMFNTDYVNPRIQKQIKTYIEEYHFSYSGILRSLIYFYEVKNNSLKKSNDGIGM